MLKNPFTFCRLYIDPAVVLQKIFQSGGTIVGIDQIYDHGWWFAYDQKSATDWTNVKATIGSVNRLDETLQEIRKMKDICDENGIKFVVFTNPMYEVTYEASLENDWPEFLKQLSTITDFYNFSGINDVTTNHENYIDGSHNMWYLTAFVSFSPRVKRNWSLSKYVISDTLFTA